MAMSFKDGRENFYTDNEITLMRLGLYETSWIIERNTFPHDYGFFDAWDFYNSTERDWKIIVHYDR